MHPSRFTAANRISSARVKADVSSPSNRTGTEAILRDMAFVLQLTQRVKQAIQREVAASN